MTERKEDVNYRIRKKKGLLNTELDRKLKERIRLEMEAQAEELERRAEHVQLPKVEENR